MQRFLFVLVFSLFFVFDFAKANEGIETSCQWMGAPLTFYCKNNQTVYQSGNLKCGEANKPLLCSATNAMLGLDECENDDVDDQCSEPIQKYLVQQKSTKGGKLTSEETTLLNNNDIKILEPVECVAHVKNPATPNTFPCPDGDNKNERICIFENTTCPGSQGIARDVACRKEACTNATTCAYNETQPQLVKACYDRYKREEQTLSVGLPVPRKQPARSNK